MPRKKKPSSRGSSPEKPVGPNFFEAAGQNTSAWKMSWPLPRDFGQNESGLDRDQIFQNIQEMFKDKVEADVVHMVLQECDWKVDEAVEKLFMLNPGSDDEMPTLKAQPITISSVAETLYKEHSHDTPSSEVSHVDNPYSSHFTSVPDMSEWTSYKLPEESFLEPVLNAKVQSDFSPTKFGAPSVSSDLSSKFPPLNLGPIPTTGNSLQMLSPKTPAVANVDFPFPHGMEKVSKDENVQSALEAFDAFARNSSTSVYQQQQSFTASLYDFYVPTQGRAPNMDQSTLDPTVHSLLQNNNNVIKDSDGNPVFTTVAESVPRSYFKQNSGSSLGEGSTTQHSRSKSLSPPNFQLGHHRVSGLNGLHQSSTESSTDTGSSRSFFEHRQSSTSSSDAPSSAHSLKSPFFPKSGLPAEFAAHPEYTENFIMPPSSPRINSFSSNTEHSVRKAQPEPQVTDKKHPMQFLRHQNISLDPTERENLERLIDEVIRGGVTEGALDNSDDSSTEDEVINKTPEATGKKMKLVADAALNSSAVEGSNVPQANLKVAAKHMKNLPPRFLKRLQASNNEEDESDEDTSPDTPMSPQSESEGTKKPESKKKKKREILKGLDVFMDEQGVKVLELVPTNGDPTSPTGQLLQKQSHNDNTNVVVSSVSLTEPSLNNGKQKEETTNKDLIKVFNMTNIPANSISSPKSSDHASRSGTETPRSVKALKNPNIILRQDAVNCEELEKELLKITGQARESPVPYKPRPKKTAVLTEPPKVTRVTESKQDARSLVSKEKANTVDDQASSKFSVNAPEFVPRAFTPINVPVSTVPADLPVMIQPPVKSRSPFHPVMGRHSPQIPVYVANTPPGRHSPAHSPAFMIPKVSHISQNAAAAVAAASMHPHAGMVPVQHYPTVQPYAYHHPHYKQHYSLRHAYRHQPPYPVWMPEKGDKHIPGRGVFHPFALTGHHLTASPHKEKILLHPHHLAATTRSNSAPTIFPVNPKMAANLQPVTLYPSMATAGKSMTDPSSKVPGIRSSVRERSPLVKQAAVRSPREIVEALIKEEKKVMVILRGCPGSGKSTLARELKFSGIILSTDDFFINNGVYEYDINKLADAHEWNQKRTREALTAGTNPIIIDNTNTQAWEMKFYVKKALEHGYCVEIVEPDTSWKFKVKELSKRNSHGVPVEIIQRMVDRYEHNLGVSDIVGKLESADPQEEENEQIQDTSVQDPEKKKKRRKRRRKRKSVEAMKSLDGEKSSDEETTDGTCTSREASLDVDEHPDDLKPPKELILGESIEEVEEEESKERNIKQISSTDNKTHLPHDSNLLGSPKVNTEVSNGLQLERHIDDVPTLVLDGGNAVTEENVPDKKLVEKLKRSHRVPLKLDIDQDKKGLVKEVPQEFQHVPVEHLETPDFLKADIEDFIKDKILEGLINEEVAQITGLTPHSSTGYDLSTLVKPVPLNPYVTEHKDSVELKKKDHFEPNTGEKQILKQEISGDENIEASYWKTSPGSTDLYSVQVSGYMYNEGATKEQASVSPEQGENHNLEFQENDVTPKPKRVRKRERKGMTLEGSDASSQDQKNDSDSVPSTPVTPQTPSSASKKSLIKTRLAAKFHGSNTDSPDANEWDLPDFNSPEVTDVIPKNSTPEVHVKTVGIITCPSDFSLVHKILNGLFIAYDEEDKFQQILETSPRDIQVFKPEETSDVIQSSKHEKLKLDKGCSTDDLQQICESEGLNFLMDCFPSISVDDLNDILNRCGGNTEWAVNIMLDSGYEYNFHNSTEGGADINEQKDYFVNQIAPRKDVIDNEDETKSNVVGKESNQLNSPPPLMLLCHATLAPTQALLSDSVQENIVKKSVCRLESIEQFKLQHHPGEESQTSSDQLNKSKSSSASLDLSTDSQFSDILSPSDSVFKAETRLKRLISDDGKQQILTTVYTPEVQPNNENTDVILEEVTETVIVESSSNEDEQYPNNGEIEQNSPQLPVREKINALAQLMVDYEEAGSGASSPDISTHSGSSHQVSSTGPEDVDTQNVPTELPCEKRVDATAAEEEDDMMLTLSPALAKQLIIMFGPVGFHISPDSLDADDLRVRLNRGTAKNIHHRWSMTLHEKFALEELAIKKMIKEDEALARKLQEEEEVHHMSKLVRPLQREHVSSSVIKETHPPPLIGAKYCATSTLGSRESTSSNPCVVEAAASPASMVDIMNEQLAAQQSQRTAENKDFSLEGATLAAKIKMKKLQEMFKDIEPTVVAEIMEGTGYSMDQSIRLIRGSQDGDAHPSDVMTAEEMSAYEASLMQQVQHESLQDQWLGTGEDEGKPDFQSLEDPDYQDFRAEASHHYQLRHECFQKAQEAYSSNMKSVASFYSQQGHLHTTKLREANRRAAERILAYRNSSKSQPNQVDLHGLHVDEAVQALERIIAEKEADFRKYRTHNRMSLEVITGKGNRSRQGMARIKPAVKDFLDRNNYQYSEPQPGLVKVFLKL